MLAKQFVRLNSGAAATLNWNQFFALKKQRRNINMVCGAVAAAASGVATGGYAANVEILPLEKILGMDPTMVVGLTVAALMPLGYLVGQAAIGDTVFALANRRTHKEFVAKEKVFLEHVARNRPDPGKLSVANPIPDYYGEKIMSLADYKKWLKDCHTFTQRSENLF